MNPRAKTKRGTELEVIRHLGCGDMMVRPLKTNTDGVCNVTQMEPRTPEDGERINEMVKT